MEQIDSMREPTWLAGWHHRDSNACFYVFVSLYNLAISILVIHPVYASRIVQ